MARASVSTLAAATLVLVALTTVAVAAIRVSRESSAQLAEYLRDLYRVYSASIEVRISDVGVVITSSTPIKLLAAYLVEGGELTEVCGEIYVEGSTTIGDPSLVSRLKAGSRLLLVFEGGRYLVLDPEEGSEGVPDPASSGYESVPRLYPLLATYLRPEDYIAVTDQYVPVNVSVFTLRSYYYSTPSFVYVRVSWNSTHYVVTFRKHSSSGALLGTHYATIPSSGTMVTVPSKEYPYELSCEVRSGIRYCFEVYVTAQGWCYSRCSSPRDSLWYFAVGMRVVYRFEPVEPGYYLLVVLNRTTYEGSFGKGVATCTSYTSYGGGCVTCSTSPYVGYCSAGTSTILNVLGGPRPVFWWEVGYPQYLESSYGDDGYEEGAWYPYTSAPSFSLSPNYAYTTGGAVTVAFYLSGVRVQDYLRQLSNYQDGSYRVAFKLVYDEGGPTYDSRVWDYRVVVFLMKPREAT